jgi:methionine sulfoxide reductase heme-binding subunit
LTQPDPAHYGWWLAARSAGVVAFLLIAAAVTLGLFMASNMSRRPGLKRTLVAVHEQIALAALIGIALHGVLLLGDGWLRPGIAGITVPLWISYRPAFVALGIVGGYLAALLGLTYYARKRIGARRWRRFHRATVVVYVLAVVHCLGSGTDGASLWLRVLVVASMVPIAVLVVLRYRPRSRKAPATLPRPSTAAQTPS